MDKKKTRKSKTAKSMRNLPAKALDAKTAEGVKAGTYGRIKWTYTQQKP